MALKRSSAKAASACRHVFNKDYNGEKQTGFGYAQASQKAGRRYSSASAFLNPVRHRGNLKVIMGAQVKRVLFKEEQANGVAYRRAGHDYTATCNGEVILSAGA